jgi:DNA-3-methyladenine glycosylase I
MKKRCPWVNLKNKKYVNYHDSQWGRPVRKSQELFAKLCLDGAQAGLSWETILNKMEGYYDVFDNFDPKKCAKYTDKQLDKKLKDARIVRNRLKVYSVRTNAKAYLEVEKEFGSFSKYLWSFVDHKTIYNTIKDMSNYPTTSVQSDAMSKDLKKRGFKFVGSTICYAFMQAVGMVNDHTIDCFRHPSNLSQ